jgi:hypothetical protein
MNLPLKKLLFNRKILSNDNNKTFIVFDSLVDKDFIQWLKNNYPNSRIILWYWNPVKKTILPDSINDNICEKWTYSLRDSKQFNIKHNTTFYNKEIEIPKINNSEYDIFFIGRDKGRLNKLKSLKKEFNKMNLTSKFHITPTKRYMGYLNKNYEKNITYEKVLNNIANSKGILDILADPTDGLSLRPMESLFFEKKLITNSVYIRKYDFYDPHNIFILGDDNIKNLPKFIKGDYKKISQKIIDKYDFYNWINNFD